MAKTGRRRGNGESTMGYFKRVLRANPNLLAGKSNKKLMARWRRDHPDFTEIDEKKAAQSLANTKSTLRREQREAGNNHRPQNASMEQLEVNIDDCYRMAWNLGSKDLEEVIRHLRLARNKVVLLNG